MTTILCPICRKPTLKEIPGKKVKNKFANFKSLTGIKNDEVDEVLVQCSECHCYWEMTILKDSKRLILESVMLDEIVDAAPKRTGPDLEQYLKSSGWHKIFTEDKEFLGWWHPEISPQSGRVYPPWAAQIIQNGIDDFIYSHLKRP